MRQISMSDRPVAPPVETVSLASALDVFLPGLPAPSHAPNLFSMNLNSPFFDRIRVKAAPQPALEQPRCDHPALRRAGRASRPHGAIA